MGHTDRVGGCAGCGYVYMNGSSKHLITEPGMGYRFEP